MSVTVAAEAKVNPTEDEKKVEQALNNIFPSAPVERMLKPDEVTVLKVHGEGLEFMRMLRSLIKQEQIRSAARSILLSSAWGSPFRFWINKQAAFAGRVSFCAPEGESPLGPITIQVDATDTESVVDYLASSPQVGFEKGFRRARRG